MREENALCHLNSSNFLEKHTQYLQLILCVFYTYSLSGFSFKLHRLTLTYAFVKKWYLKQDIFFKIYHIKASTKKSQTTVSSIMLIMISSKCTTVCMTKALWNVDIGTDQTKCSRYCTSFIANY